MIVDHRDITSLFIELDEIIETCVPVYLIGGGAMMKHGVKNQTKDIDLVVRNAEDYETLFLALKKIGFRSISPEAQYGRLELSQVLVRDDYQIDLFNRTVCGKLHLSEGMISRSKQESFLKNIGLHLCALEDILIFKSVTERGGDREDAINIIRNYPVRWDLVVSEIKYQVSVGEDVWITWMAAFFDELTYRSDPIEALKEIDELSDRYFERLELEKP